MSSYGVIRQALEDLLVQTIPEFDSYRLELQVPASNRAGSATNTLSSTYNTGTFTSLRTARMTFTYSVQAGDPNDETIDATERDVIASDRLVDISRRVSDAINEFSRCGGKLAKEITQIECNYDNAVDSREDDDLFVWTFVEFEMSWHDRPRLPQ